MYSNARICKKVFLCIEHIIICTCESHYSICDFYLSLPVQGEEEAEFQEFLRNIKVIYDNLAMLCPQLVLRSVYSILSSTLAQWQSASFNDIEVAIRYAHFVDSNLTNLRRGFELGKEKICLDLIEN